MAMLQMQRIFIYALKKDRKPILELLQRHNIIEINDVIPEDNVFHKMDMSYAKSSLEKSIASAKDALEILNRFSLKKKPFLSILNGRKIISTDNYDDFKAKHDSILRTANHIIAYAKEIAENKAELIKLQTQAEMLVPWTNLDIPLEFDGTKYTKSFIGTIPNEWTLEKIYETLAEYLPLNIDIISTSKEQTCIFVLCTKGAADNVYEALRNIEFSHPSISSEKAPADQLADMEKQKTELSIANDKAAENIIALASCLEEIQFLQDYDKMRADKYEVIGEISQSQNIFILSGYIPKSDSKALEDTLNEKFELAIELEDPTDEDDVPVLLNNNGFSQPLEGIVNGFALPGKGEIDPTMIMSLFYYMLFGLMLSDAGYGAIMVIACGFGLIKFKGKMEKATINILKMYLFCGISTIFWGIMFGSYFGDIVDVVSESFFGNKITIPPLWFFPVNEPMKMLSFSLLIGIIHLLTGLTMKFIQLWRQKDYKAVFYDAVSWFVLILSCTFLLLSMQMIREILGVKMLIPSIVKSISSVAAILAAAVIVFTNGRESRNPFKRFLKGAYALYGISGYLSDVLSYSRLLALGLATGIIGSVINKMAAMTAGGILGPLFFTIIVLGGHTLNIGINALGAYVHTCRLQYVEFFGKFYEGGGRPFEPFGMKTKYYKVKE